jgi:hypothetical protein
MQFDRSTLRILKFLLKLLSSSSFFLEHLIMHELDLNHVISRMESSADISEILIRRHFLLAILINL